MCQFKAYSRELNSNELQAVPHLFIKKVNKARRQVENYYWQDVAQWDSLGGTLMKITVQVGREISLPESPVRCR